MTTKCTLSCEAVPNEDPETGEPCAVCTAALEKQHAYWRNYFHGMPREPSREEYREQMIDAGRGHLLRDEER